MFSKKKNQMPRLRLSLHTEAGKRLHGGRTAFRGGYADESADALFGGRLSSLRLSNRTGDSRAAH